MTKSQLLWRVALWSLLLAVGALAMKWYASPFTSVALADLWLLCTTR